MSDSTKSPPPPRGGVLLSADVRLANVTLLWVRKDLSN
jgi:hypothetical protein